MEKLCLKKLEPVSAKQASDKGWQVLFVFVFLTTCLG